MAGLAIGGAAPIIDLDIARAERATKGASRSGGDKAGARPHVIAYVKNEHLDFEMFYEWRGEMHRYLPDYTVRLSAKEHGTVNLILEVKGLEDEQDRAKRAVAERWCKAVNNDGRFGTWAYYQTRKPAELKQLLDTFHARACAGQPIVG